MAETGRSREALAASAGGFGRASPRFLAAEIPSAETSASDRWKPVTLYDVRITAVGRREVWTVYRRYSKFYDLRVQLQKRFPSHALPPIPPKRLLGKEDPQFIEQRRHELEEFLNALLREPVEISLSEEVCLFLEVPEPLRLCFLETDARMPTLPPVSGEAPRLAGAGGGAADESRVAWLLAQLQDLANSKAASLRAFEDWILRARPTLQEQSVQLLYLGLELQGGLLEEVGAFEHSDVSSVAALGLLCKLLSHEHCGEAQVFRAVLRRLDLSVLARMRLHNHIHRNRGQSSRLDAFCVLRALDLSPDRLSALLQDDYAIREFRFWQEGLRGRISFRTLHRACAAPRRAANAQPSGLLAQPPLSRREYRAVAESAFASVQTCLSTFALPDASDASSSSSCGAATEGASTAPGSSSTPSHAAAAAAAVGPARAAAEAARAALQGDSTPTAGEVAGADASAAESRPQSCAAQQQWQRVPCPDPAWGAKYGIVAAYQHLPSEQQSVGHAGGPDPDAYIVRAAMRLPFPARLVAGLLADHSQFIREALALRRSQLPSATVTQLELLADGQLVSQLRSASTIESLNLGTAHEAYTELIECILGTPSAPHVSVRLWLLRCLRILPAAPVAAAAAAVGQGGEGAGGGQEGAEVEEPPPPPPSYLFLCTAVPPAASSPRERDQSQPNGAASETSGARQRTGSPSGSGAASALRLVSLKPSGVLVRPSGPNEAEVSLCALLGKDSVKLVSGDLLGERLLFWRTLENALFALEQLCPLPEDFKHPLAAHEERCLSTPVAEPEEEASSPGSGSLLGLLPGGPRSRSSSSASQRSLEVELVEDEGSTFN